MITVTFVLVLGALIAAIVSAMGRCPLWGFSDPALHRHGAAGSAAQMTTGEAAQVITHHGED